MYVLRSVLMKKLNQERKFCLLRGKVVRIVQFLSAL